ncbi:MAG TPA: dienelactone hydrolase family protein [Bacteroidota bacterium]|nr:dienelactone hydrolase family protein [Bacteroidota bacterium]
MNEYLSLNVSDATQMRMYVSRPMAGGPVPGIIVFQEAYGVNAHIRDVADRFARQGFLAVAPEMYHRTGPGFEGDYKDFQGLQKHFGALTEEGADADIRASYGWLSTQSSVNINRIACVGFCMGGRFAFQANSIVPMRAAISFYGGGIAETLLGRVSRLQGPTLLFWGGRDARITPEKIRAVVDALRAADKVYTSVEFSQAGHGFFCDAREAYHKESAEQAWALLLNFLQEHC